MPLTTLPPTRSSTRVIAPRAIFFSSRRPMPMRASAIRGPRAGRTAAVAGPSRLRQALGASKPPGYDAAMPDAAPPDAARRVDLALARAADGSLALHLRVAGGRAVLRLDVGGVQADGTAVEEGVETGIAPEELAGGSLALAWDDGRRERWFFDALDPAALAALEVGRLHPLRPRRDGGRVVLDLDAPRPPPPEPAEAESTEADLPPTSLGSRPAAPPPGDAEVIRHLRAALSRERRRAYRLQRRVERLEAILAAHGLPVPGEAPEG